MLCTSYWPIKVKAKQVPIFSITEKIHTLYWIAFFYQILAMKYLMLMSAPCVVTVLSWKHWCFKRQSTLFNLPWWFYHRLCWCKACTQMHQHICISVAPAGDLLSCQLPARPVNIFLRAHNLFLVPPCCLPWNIQALFSEALLCFSKIFHW